MNDTPRHYDRQVQPVELIEAFELNFALGNVIKYVCRCDKKHDDNGLEDLNKARIYLEREIWRRRLATLVRDHSPGRADQRE